MKKRIFAVIDIEGERLDELDTSDWATWIDSQLRGNERGTFQPVVVYDKFEDLTADREERVGAFDEDWNARLARLPRMSSGSDANLRPSNR